MWRLAKLAVTSSMTLLTLIYSAYGDGYVGLRTNRKEGSIARATLPSDRRVLFNHFVVH